MVGANDASIHPGVYVKQHVIPKSMTVTKAASILRVGRPALSNFLNGKAALSQEMALRLERAFGVDREKLLDLQARFSRLDEPVRRHVVTGTHAPILVSIKAADIAYWADNKIEARQELAALLRHLIHSTGRDLIHVDFPAYDNAERPGWDGVVEAKTPTLWVPDGKSGWEFGCNQSPHVKANRDYAARVNSIPHGERHAHSFVFVTPRNWKKKKEWAMEKAKRGDWKDVLAYDASDLEQWIEQSSPTQIWFAERLGMPVSGYQSLERCWEEWAEACDPTLSPALFDPAVKQFSEAFERWLKEPPRRPLIVAADSRGEAFAFLRCLIGKVASETIASDTSAVVFDRPEAIQRFDTFNTIPRIAVLHNPEVEKAIGGLFRRCHCVIIRPGNDVNAEPDVRLGLLRWEDFSVALKAMGASEDKIDRLARESARSPTVLRRRLSDLPAVHTPQWAEDQEKARKLLPMALTGAWHHASRADREVVRLLAEADNDSDVDNTIAALLALDDPPLWSVGEYRGVVSRIDALFGIAKFVIASDLENFFVVAEYVLSETDPALDLPEDKRWIAAVYEKVRDHSTALRRGICETLILLAVFGSRLFTSHLSFNVENRVAALVRKLLTPLDHEKLLSQNDNLRDYAEAAPEELLALLETDLKQPTPAVLELMRPAISPLDSPLRTDLLWALECLAWNAQRFPRVVNVLAKLCNADGTEVHDNYVNKPGNTLSSLFLSWMPQTAAPLDVRIHTFERLCRNYPMLGWRLCTAQLDYWKEDVAMPTHRPRWRDDATNAGHVTTKTEHFTFYRKVLDLAIDWPCHDERTLTDLIQQLEVVTENDQFRIWDSIDQWIDSAPSEEAKAYLRQRIYRCAYARGLRKKAIAHPERERAVSSRLLPQDRLIRHAWLFESHCVELPPDDSENEEFDYEKNDQRLRELRLQALREIWEERNFDGIRALLDRNEQTSHLVGELMAKVLAEGGETGVEFVKSCLLSAVGNNAFRYKSCLGDFLRHTGSDRIATLVKEFDHASDQDALLTLLLCLPCVMDTWRWLDDKPASFREAYWQNVKPHVWINDASEDEINRSIDALLAVNRATAAFEAVYLMFKKVETSRILKLLNALLVTHDSDGFWEDRNNGYYISKAFDVLDVRPSITVEKKARLEFAYFAVLDRSEHGIPNLEKQIAASPAFYAERIACCFKRKDGGEDPPDLRDADPEKRRTLATNARRLLERMQRIPGTDAQENINPDELKTWLGQVRSRCARLGRADIGDQTIGKLLSWAPEDEDGVWPCRPVCEALESMTSDQVSKGFVVGTLNHRGVYVNNKGGDQERDLAARYRGLASKLTYEYPYASRVLDRIAADYEHQAQREDIEFDVRERLPYP